MPLSVRTFTICCSLCLLNASEDKHRSNVTPGRAIVHGTIRLGPVAGPIDDVCKGVKIVSFLDVLVNGGIECLGVLE